MARWKALIVVLRILAKYLSIAIRATSAAINNREFMAEFDIAIRQLEDQI